MTFEPPRGIRGKVLRELGQVDQSFFDSIGRGGSILTAAADEAAMGRVWRRLLYSVTLMHAVLIERRRFGPLGWDIAYDFSSTGERPWTEACT